MGGLREDVIESEPATQPKKQSKSAKTGTTGPAAQSIRFHEDPATGQVHFHDDANNLKAGVPVAEWYAAWRKISQSNNGTEGYGWTYYDHANQSVLHVRTSLRQFTAPPTLEIEITVAPMTFGTVYEQLQKFIPKSK